MGSMNIYNGTNKASITYSGTSDKTIDANDLVSGTNIKTVNGSSLLGSGDMPIYTGFKNYIINGNFDVWQRGTSQTSGGYGSADRWYFGWASGSLSVSKYNGSDGVGCTLTATSLVGGYMYQHIEDVRNLNGKTATVSFLWTLVSGTPVITNTRLTQMFGTGGSTAVEVNPAQLPDLTTSGWKSFTVNIPSTLGKTVNTTDSSLRFLIGLAGTFSGTISHIQLEEGSVATPFEQRPYGLELSLCQRYYVKFMAQQNAFAFFAQGAGYGTTFARVGVPTRVTMRAIPTLGSSAASTFALEGTVSGGVNSIIGYGTTTANYLVWQVNTASNVSGALWLYANNTTSAYLDASAEL